VRHALAFALCAAIGTVQAQEYLSGSVSVVSNYLWRGYSMSDGRPAAQATFAYDHPSGAYAGAFVSNVRLGPEQETGVQGLGYAGYSARLTSGLSWDAGIAYSDFSRPSDYSYAEYHVGLAHVDWSAKLSYAPRYFGSQYSASYAELNLTPWSDRELTPFLHVGLLYSAGLQYLGSRRIWDGRIGLAYSFDLATVQLSWSIASSDRTPTGGYVDRSAWVLRLTRWL
jgi:uncharacterized protein (TIGR02001 family)